MTNTTPQDRLDCMNTAIETVQRVLEESRETTERVVLSLGEMLSSIVETSTVDLDTIRNELGLVDESGETKVTSAIKCQSESVTKFVSEIRELLRRQLDFSTVAGRVCNHIQDCAKDVTKLMERSHILALNMRIESNRIGVEGHAFSVIADEMSRFSYEVRDSNGEIIRALKELGEVLPVIRNQAMEMDRHANDFTEALDQQLLAISDHAHELNHALSESLHQADTRNRKILGISHKTLSTLQFQDPLAKQLETASRELELVQKLVNDPTDETDLQELNNMMSHNEVCSTAAGEVVLF